MERSKNQTFKVIGGKTPKEMVIAMASGFYEAFRVAIPGGFEVVIAKTVMGSIGGVRKQLFILDEMPPSELVDPSFEPQNAELGLADNVTLRGKYGIVQGRKFFVETTESAPKPTAASRRKAS